MPYSESFSAAVLTEINKPLRIEKLKFPSLGWGQVLVRVSYSSICASQLFEISGGRGEDKYIPHLLGHEGYGGVVDVGPGVSRFKIGDPVILTWIQQPGIDCDPVVYETVEGVKINSGKVSTFSDFAVVSESRLFIAPSGISSRFLPLLGCAALTGAGMIFELENHSNRSLVIGGGGVGLFAVLALSRVKNIEVHLVETNAKKREIFQSIVPDVRVYPDLSDSKLLEELELNGLFSEVYECTGDIDSLQRAFSFVSSTGTMIFATHPRDEELLWINPHDLIKGKKILGSWGGGCRDTSRRDQVIDFFCRIVDILPRIVSTPFQLSEINSAIEYARGGNVNRVLLELKP